jgi:transcriptional antiterminator NusG
MEEERIELAELDTIETEDVQEDAQETLAEEAEPALEPEAAARRLFASYLEPSEDKPEQEEEKPDDLPEPVDEVVAALPVDGADLIVLVDEQESEDESAPAEGTAPDGDASADDDDGDEPSEGGRNWYVIHSYSGYENKVKKNLEHRIESLGMQHKIFEVVVPTEEEIELKDGQRRTVERRIFPGYILVDMLMDEDSWYVVRNTPGVTGFVGSVRKPTPLRQRDVDKILKRMRAETPRVTVTFVPGQKVRIADGPFEDFVGAVDEIFADKGKVRILVSFFGRETPVELDFLQVEKL